MQTKAAISNRNFSEVDLFFYLLYSYPALSQPLAWFWWIDFNVISFQTKDLRIANEIFHMQPALQMMQPSSPDGESWTAASSPGIPWEQQSIMTWKLLAGNEMVATVCLLDWIVWCVFYLAPKFPRQQIRPQWLNPSDQWYSQNGRPSPRWRLSGGQSLRWIPQNKPNHSSSPLGGQRRRGLSRRRSESASHNQSRKVASLPHIHRHRHLHLEKEQGQREREREERGQWKVGLSGHLVLVHITTVFMVNGVVIGECFPGSKAGIGLLPIGLNWTGILDEQSDSHWDGFGRSYALLLLPMVATGLVRNSLAAVAENQKNIPPHCPPGPLPNCWDRQI